MNLVVVTPYPPTITGIGQYGYHVTRSLAATKHFSRVSVLAGARSSNDERPQVDLDALEIKYCWRPDQLNARALILNEIRRLKPDVVWFNLGASIFGNSTLANLSGLFTPWQTRRMGYPTVVTLHELIPLADLHALNAPGGIFAGPGARLLTRIATQADVVCMTMSHYANWLSARGVDCMYIPIGAYHSPSLLAETDSPELLFFTTLAPFKGLELLLASLGELRREFPKLQLSVAGAEHMRFPDYVQDLRSRFNGDHGVHWLGQVPEDQVIGLFERAQIVVLPYTASSGSSSVLYQAATWGRAVVASNLKETRQVARENDLRVEFFTSGSRESLQESIRALLRSPERRAEQARHNFESIQQLTPSSTCARYMEAFERALRKHSKSNSQALSR